MSSGQPDYSCDQASYQLQVEDPATPGSYIDSIALSWLTLDDAFSQMKMSIALSDTVYLGEVNYLLKYAGQDSVTFKVKGC